MRWILDRRERGLSNKILKIYSIRSAGERNFFESRKISAGGWRIIYASQRNLIVERKRYLELAKLLYTNFQRERRIHDMHISSIELRKKSLSRIDISFGISTLGSSSGSPETTKTCRFKVARNFSTSRANWLGQGILQEFGWFSIQNLIHPRVNRYLYEKPRSRFEIVIHPVTQTYLSRNGSKRMIYLWRNCYTIGGHLSKNSQTILSLSTFPLLSRLDSIKPEWEKRFHLAKGERGGVKIHPSFRFSS